MHKILSIQKQRDFSITPDFIAESVQDINFKILSAKGITTCFLDLDGTVVERGAFAVSQDTIAALKNSELNIYIATNRSKSRDLKNLREDLGAVGVIHPRGLFGKPTKQYYLNALQETNRKATEVVMIGDRYFQDIYGANRAGLYSLLVHKLGRHKGIFDRLISDLEKKISHSISKNYTKV